MVFGSWLTVAGQIASLLVCLSTVGSIRLRLRGSATPNAGRVEVYHRCSIHRGQWGTVCDDNWDDKDATAVCRSLGFTTGKAYVGAFFGRGRGQIWLDNVSCSRFATDFGQCHHPGWGRHNCHHGQDAGVRCFRKGDGQWGGWNGWSPCSVSCEFGIRRRSRVCDSPAPAYNGRPCAGHPDDTKLCFSWNMCPIDGEWGGWNDWSPCSVSCENGTRTRSRVCDSPEPAYNGRPCEEYQDDKEVCDPGIMCPIDGEWGGWIDWSPCSVSCENGTRTRSRVCDSPEPAYNGRPCEGYQDDKEVCDPGIMCPIDGEWGGWNDWSPCSVSCENGTRTRSRVCDSPEPAYNGRPCEGYQDDMEVCDPGIMCPIDGEWRGWIDWSPCSVSCENGTRTRSRVCDSPEPAYNGRPCEGYQDDKEVCDPGIMCPIDGEWGGWNDWSPCSVSCENGTRTRYRVCDSPEPAYNGRPCEGYQDDMDVCDPGIMCPIDGEWGGWIDWSPCSVSCENGTRTRSRVCDSPAPAYNGRQCDGHPDYTQICDSGIMCPIDGQWGRWTDWSPCSVSCENGTRTRSRVCDSPALAYNGRSCEGYPDEMEVCDSGIICPIDGEWGGWNDWSPCSVSCENGTRTRSHVCDSPEPAYNGRPCEGYQDDMEVCDPGIMCPIDGEWGGWIDWSPCSVSCENGTRTRSRVCDSPEPAYNGRPCEGYQDDKEVCDPGIMCPIDGEWGGWNDWPPCSVSCENGTRTRYRVCDNPEPAYNGRPCEGYQDDMEVCDPGIMCPIDGEWGGWIDWSPCSVSCENGTRTRSRVCDSPAPAYNGRPCEGYQDDKEVCDPGIMCPIDGEWGGWNDWSPCSVSCENGTRTRYRVCDNPKPAYNGRPCEGYQDDMDVCDPGIMCPIDGEWGGWNDWSPCSVSCENGTRTRYRVCDNPEPAYNGRPCEGYQDDMEVCDPGIMCPIDGEWGGWIDWSPCSVSCENGTRTRYRVCDSPEPAYNGRPCEGYQDDKEVCDPGIMCPIDGEWGGWNDWSPCSVSCENGTRTRYRVCDNPEPAYNGRPCEGYQDDMEVCDPGIMCPIDGEWGGWIDWSPCSVSCENGTRTRSRVCDNPEPAYNGRPCEGYQDDMEVCDPGIMCPIDGEWGGWNDWSPCSVSCENGTRTRYRVCDSPAPAYNGRPCEGYQDDKEVCDPGIMCPIDGEWGEWIDWSPCSVSCENGTRTRYRVCDSPGPAFNGRPCEGYPDVMEVCDPGIMCPIGGQWGEWNDWSSYSLSCENDTRTRYRVCDSPSPAFNGRPCAGYPDDMEVCDPGIRCPIDGEWGGWYDWSPCSVSCANGTRTRSRVCDGPSPAYNGRQCEGYPDDTEVCDSGIMCPIDGHWGAWSNWSICSVTCECGEKVRSRDCDNPLPNHGGKPCSGNGSETAVCGVDMLCPGGCGKDTLMCSDKRTCIDAYMSCDGVKQCPDGGDEVNCVGHSVMYIPTFHYLFSGAVTLYASLAPTLIPLLLLWIDCWT